MRAMRLVPAASPCVRGERHARPRAVPGHRSRRIAMPAAPATAPRPRRTGPSTLPVVEIFGPTVQGEGPDAGVPAYFVRFGGCDWRCTWCDSMHAVEPAQVRQNAERLTVAEITDRVRVLPEGPRLVVLSG